MTKAPQESLILDELKKRNHRDVQLHLFANIASTSVWLRDQFMGIAPQTGGPHLCATDWQTAGIARRGKTWQTKPGNITFSILSTTDKPTQDLLGLSLVTGIGVADALQEYAEIPVQLKWPNDVLVGDAKLGGLLTEINTPSDTRGTPAATQVLTGIGINFLHDPDVLDLGIGATSLVSCGVAEDSQQRDRLIGKLSASVMSAHEQFYESGWSVFAKRWDALDWLVNKEVNIHSQQSMEQAIARGVNDRGALLVERSGTTYPVYGGNVSIRPTV